MHGPSGGFILETPNLYLDVLVLRPGNAPHSDTALSHLSTPGLIDTGASRSCIDKSLVDRLELVRTGEDYISGISGGGPANIYHAIVNVPRLNFREAMELYCPINQPVLSQVLLGRDFLVDFSVLYDGQQKRYSFYRLSQHDGSSFVDDE